jgi:hypothetical protein
LAQLLGLAQPGLSAHGESRGGRGALVASARQRWSGRCQRPDGEDWWAWQLEGDGEAVNRFEGFGEEGAHHDSSSTTARASEGAPLAVGWRGGGGH